MMTGRGLLIVALAVLAWLGPRPAVLARSPGPDEREGAEFFEKAVRPVLVERCWSCHGGPVPRTKAKTKGGLNLTTRAGLLAGGDSGPAAVAGKPEESLLSGRSATTTSRGCRRRSGWARSRSRTWAAGSSSACRGRRRPARRGREPPEAAASPSPAPRPPHRPPLGRSRPRPLVLPAGGRPAGPGGPRPRLAARADRPRSSWPRWSSTG